MRYSRIVYPGLLLSLVLPHVAFAQVTVGAMAELSGQFAKVGEDCRRGYELAQKVYNSGEAGTRVIVADNQGEAKAGLTEFQRLVSSENASVVVTSRSPVGLAINPVSKQKQIPLVGIVAHPAFTADNPFALRVFPSSSVEGEMLAQQVAAAGVTRLATLTLEDEYFLSLTNRLVEKVGKDKLILAETVLPADTDYGAVLLRIKASKPDAILLNAGPKQLTSMLKWLHEQRVESKLFSNFLVSTPDVIAASGDAAEGVVFVQLDYDKPKFREYLKQAFGTEDSSPVGFSCLVGLATVLQTIDSTKSQPELLTAQLLRVEKVDVLGETVTFANREAQLNLVPRRIHGGSVQPL